MWEQIQANRRRSVVLIAGLGVVLVALGYCAGEGFAGPGAGPVGILVGLAVWGAQLGTCFLGAQSIVLHGTFAKELKREDSPRLFNIVEEMKLASGAGFMPRIYLIDDPAPNAFAFGVKPERSAIAVTTGLMHRLNRDELQGVIGHEIAHLKNRDVQFMTLAAATLGAIVILSDIVGRTMRYGLSGRSRSSSRGGGGGQAQLVLFLVALVFAILGPIVAQMLYFACSRKREHLADACSAQFTRYPEGLASALEKISGAATPVAFANRVNGPMFIVNPLDGGGMGLFSTHPATQERVRILRSMAGGSLADYEAAYRQSLGKGLIGARSLRAAAAQPIREPSGEGPVEDRRAAKTLSHRLGGYLTLQCPCGVSLSVPEGYERAEARCVRCGRSLPLPAASVSAPPAAGASLGQAAPPPVEESVLQYSRTGSGWEAFRCTCGRTLQLSPSFNAGGVVCPGCGKQIRIV